MKDSERDRVREKQSQRETESERNRVKRNREEGVLISRNVLLIIPRAKSSYVLVVNKGDI